MTNFISALKATIENLSGSHFALLAALLSVVVFTTGWRCFTALHRKRMITATPTSWLRSAAQGYSELVGRGIQIPGTPLVSPFSGRECLWYRVQTQELSTDGSDKAPEIPILNLIQFVFKHGARGLYRGGLLDESSDDLFYLDDDTGRCVIDPEGAEIRPTLKRHWYGKTPTPDRGPAIKGSRLGSRYRYTEELLLPGDILYAIGDLKTKGGAALANSMQDEVRDLLREWKADQTELLARFDRDQNGQICEAEWQQARNEADEHIQERHRNNDVPVSITMLQKSSDARRPYVISSESLHVVEARFQRTAQLYFVISLISVICLACLLSMRV